MLFICLDSLLPPILRSSSSRPTSTADRITSRPISELTVPPFWSSSSRFIFRLEVERINVNRWVIMVLNIVGFTFLLLIVVYIIKTRICGDSMNWYLFQVQGHSTIRFPSVVYLLSVLPFKLVARSKQNKIGEENDDHEVENRKLIISSPSCRFSNCYVIVPNQIYI